MAAMVDLSARSGQVLLRRRSPELQPPHLWGRWRAERAGGGLAAIAAISIFSELRLRRGPLPALRADLPHKGGGGARGAATDSHTRYSARRDRPCQPNAIAVSWMRRCVSLPARPASRPTGSTPPTSRNASGSRPCARSEEHTS